MLIERYLSPCSDQLQLPERGVISMYVPHIMKRTYKVKSPWILWCLHHSNETSLPELFQNYFFLTILQKETLLLFVLVFSSFLLLVIFSSVTRVKGFITQAVWPIDSILSRVKKQYYRVIKFFKTSYQLHFLFSWNVFWMLIKETKICRKFKLLVLYMNIYLFPQILQGPSGTFGLHMLRKKRATLISSMSECQNLKPFLTGVLRNDILPVMMLKYLGLGLCYDNNFYTAQWSMRRLFKYKINWSIFTSINSSLLFTCLKTPIMNQKQNQWQDMDFFAINVIGQNEI